MVRNRNSPGRAIRASIVIPLTSLLLMSCLKTPWDYEQAGIHMNLGMAYIEANQYNSALKELLEAEKYTPSSLG
jgi:Tfp pilus assembly protein PilF